MKTFLALFLCAVSLQAAPFHRKPAAKPVAPAVATVAVEPAPVPLPLPEPTPRFTVNPDGSVLRSRQADAELRDWIEGIQKEAELQKGRGDKAEASLGQAVTRADTLQGEVKTVTDDRNAQAAAKDAALTERDAEHVAKEQEKALRVVAEHHVSKIKTWLAVALAAALVLLVQHLPFGLLMPPTSLYGRIAASVAAAGLAWIIVARFV